MWGMEYNYKTIGILHLNTGTKNIKHKLIMSIEAQMY